MSCDVVLGYNYFHYNTHTVTAIHVNKEEISKHLSTMLEPFIQHTLYRHSTHCGATPYDPLLAQPRVVG